MRLILISRSLIFFTAIIASSSAQAEFEPRLASQFAMRWVVSNVTVPRGSFRLPAPKYGFVQKDGKPVEIASAKPENVAVIEADAKAEDATIVVPQGTVFSPSKISNNVVCEPTRRGIKGHIACLGDIDLDGLFDHIGVIDTRETTYGYHGRVIEYGVMVGVHPIEKWRPLVRPVTVSNKVDHSLVESVNIFMKMTQLFIKSKQSSINYQICLARREGTRLSGKAHISNFCAGFGFQNHGKIGEGHSIIGGATLYLNAIDSDGIEVRIENLADGSYL